MGAKGDATRTRILDRAQALILERGYAGVSIDLLIAELGLTKGAFFHHFKSKAALARALIQRFSDDGVAFFRESLERARKLSDDPLQQFLILTGLYGEIFEGLTEPYPGCLLASYVYEMQQFDAETREIVNGEFRLARRELTRLFERISERTPPRVPVDLASLADGFMCLFEGAFVLGKSLGECDTTTQQLTHYRNYVRLLFDPALR